MNSGAGEKNYLGQREGLGGGKSGAGDEVLGGLRGTKDERNLMRLPLIPNPPIGSDAFPLLDLPVASSRESNLFYCHVRNTFHISVMVFFSF